MSAHMDFLRRRDMIVHIDKTEDEIARDMVRVNGNCICEWCGFEYRQHKYIDNCLTPEEGHPYLKILCDGTIIKL